MSFDTDHLLVRASERIAYAYVDARGYMGPIEITWRAEMVVGDWMFETDAEVRGYDMGLWRAANPGGFAKWWRHH